MVNGCGLASLAGTQLNVGSELAGQRVTLRMDGTVMAVISHDGLLLRTLRCPVLRSPPLTGTSSAAPAARQPPRHPPGR